jgi:hypothetical protein
MTERGAVGGEEAEAGCCCGRCGGGEGGAGVDLVEAVTGAGGGGWFVNVCCDNLKLKRVTSD